jgi:uncharacterized protein (TIGR01777 family)
VPRFTAESELPASAEAVFRWHARPGALQRLLPPWQRVRIERAGGVEEGETVILRAGPGPLALRWVARHGAVEPGCAFRDEQVSGPFARWIHEHRFLDREGGGSLVRDEVDWELPFARLSHPLAGRRVERALARMFRFRHLRTRQDLERHAAAPDRSLRIAVTGASGLVGTQLCAFLRTGGHRVFPLVRRAAAPGTDEIRWDPTRGTIDATALEGMDAVVHLAGESIAGRRWTEAKKRAIRESRVEGTRLLCEALARLGRPPGVLISSSAVGFYGSDRGDEALDEKGAPGSDFLARVCIDWEAATAPAAEAGVRVVHLRTGVVLTAAGGVLAQMLPPFRLGLGGPVGSGRQVISWIALDDLLGAIHFLLWQGDASGPVNAVAPAPASSRELARQLGRVLRRPAALPLPAAVVRLVLGEMGETLLLGGARVLPERLRALGFPFLFGDLESALRFELGAV